ncbi:MAG: hypothetical protein A3A47_02150 [Candidatus Levybacteria bacterium RIFCSPLOWO2_01_FULL_37_20]|nr:MAG: hypothetical protein A2770_03250 [Candidatus Levybacteria bacterium RIFCSPHIGHO2_01_FULL_38_12]OGH34372.1 MAG: hypothetical protein A3A47_02150 [Candidatus Levybacteria bacterium RIFCSPLOWO2_01_FULL_37_20]OGH44254.1 MAG: hypothetical protein A3J14_01735 [Candidatus Levybacteria bacterium RIFCSPLOWO2_02_FULL_37_18]
MVVVDTSVAFKWFASDKEDHLPKALLLLKNHLDKKEPILVPDMIVYELANAFTTKTKLTAGEIRIFLADLETIRLTIKPITIPLVTKASEFAKKYKTTVYDAFYAVLAEEKKCYLITADLQFIKQVRLPFVKHVSEYSRSTK